MSLALTVDASAERAEKVRAREASMGTTAAALAHGISTWHYCL
jgi:hypothetical protein